MVLLSPLKTTMTCFNLSIRNRIIIQTCNVELWCSRKSPMRPLTRPLRTRWKTSRIRNRNYNSSKKVGKKALQNKIEFREIKSRARQFRIRRSSDITVFENSSKKSHYKIQGIFHCFYKYLFTFFRYLFTKWVSLSKSQMRLFPMIFKYCGDVVFSCSENAILCRAESTRKAWKVMAVLSTLCLFILKWLHKKREKSLSSQSAKVLHFLQRFSAGN